jgi:hypothetical protein
MICTIWKMETIVCIIVNSSIAGVENRCVSINTCVVLHFMSCVPYVASFSGLFLFCFSHIVSGYYVLLLTDCTRSFCVVIHRLYREFMFCYSPIVSGVYVLLLTDCTWSLCFVTHRLYLEFMKQNINSRYNRLVTKHNLPVQSVSNKT